MTVPTRVRHKSVGVITADVTGEPGFSKPSLESLEEKGNYMYVPPLDSLLKSIGITRTEFECSGKIMIPAELFKLLLQVTVANSDFNAEGYLTTNPDVAEAVRDGSIENAHMHYVGFGFFEGRCGATPEVDEAWYLRTYNDVADGIRSGQIASATEHFRVIGASEGRSPSAGYSLAAEQWKRAIIGSFKTDGIANTNSVK